MVISAQQSAPVVPRNTGADVYTNYVKPTLPAKSLATSMPSNRQTSKGVVHAEFVPETSGDYEKWKKSKIFHPKQSSNEDLAAIHFYANSQDISDCISPNKSY